MLPTDPSPACAADVDCPACGTDVPDGKFCASCGVPMASADSGGRLRLNNYAAASRERVLRPWATTGLFPQLPPRSRADYRAGLILMAVAAVGFAALGWLVPVIVTSILGLPVLFLVYLRDITMCRAVRGR